MRESLFAEEEPVRVLRVRLICPRCGRKTKEYKVEVGTRNMPRKFCDSCRRINAEGLE